MNNVMVLATLAAAVAACGVTPVTAQTGPRRTVIPVPLMAIALNDLEFTNVLQGIPKTVSPHDPANAAVFEIQGLPSAAVRVELLLPTSLSSSGGGVLPITFGGTDGYADSHRGAPPTGIAFNPHGPLIAALTGSGRLYVKLGGTAHPGRPQVGGAYRANIVLTVYDLGT